MPPPSPLPPPSPAFPSLCNYGVVDMHHPPAFGPAVLFVRAGCCVACQLVVLMTRLVPPHFFGVPCRAVPICFLQSFNFCLFRSQCKQKRQKREAGFPWYFKALIVAPHVYGDKLFETSVSQDNFCSSTRVTAFGKGEGGGEAVSIERVSNLKSRKL